MGNPTAAVHEQATPLAAGSVRARVLAGVLLVLALVLAASSVAVTAAFSTQSERNLGALLDGRAQLARQLARAGVGPQQIVSRVTTDGVRAQLVLRDGTLVGTPLVAGSTTRTVQTRLAGGGRAGNAMLTLGVDTALLTDAEQTLRRVLLVVALVALVISGVAVAVIVRLGLRPLSRVASLARGITEGRRGERLRPRRTDTEIGQTAAALDEMLDELEGAEARARAAERRSQVFLADAAHELRTPVAGIRAAAETLLHTPGLSSQEREELEVLLVREATRAAGLVTALLTTARLDAGEAPTREPVELLAHAQAEVERARLLAPGTRVELDGHPVVAPADPAQVSGILRNLVDNALRVVRPDGEVRISVTSQDTPAGGLAAVDVVDSGPGVPDHERDRIFERLVRLDPARDDATPGSGLGLSISRAWARGHGGDLVCLPASGGAHFRLTLPLA